MICVVLDTNISIPKIFWEGNFALKLLMCGRKDYVGEFS